jgi:hypothetical protein
MRENKRNIQPPEGYLKNAHRTKPKFYTHETR